MKQRHTDEASLTAPPAKPISHTVLASYSGARQHAHREVVSKLGGITTLLLRRNASLSFPGLLFASDLIVHVTSTLSLHVF
jgi:hypothetical protein